MSYGPPSGNRRNSGGGEKYVPPSPGLSPRSPGGGSPGGKPRREPEEIGAILSRWLRKNRVAERSKEEGIFQYWKEIVGEEIASQTRVVKCAGGILTVEVASAPLLLELSGFYREGILESIRARPECGGIHDLRFRAGTAVPNPLAVPSPSIPEGKFPGGTVATSPEGAVKPNPPGPRGDGGALEQEGIKDWKKA